VNALRGHSSSVLGKDAVVRYFKVTHECTQAARRKRVMRQATSE
jgi:hypothetical protein